MLSQLIGGIKGIVAWFINLWRWLRTRKTTLLLAERPLVLEPVEEAPSISLEELSLLFQPTLESYTCKYYSPLSSSTNEVFCATTRGIYHWGHRLGQETYINTPTVLNADTQVIQFKGKIMLTEVGLEFQQPLPARIRLGKNVNKELKSVRQISSFGVSNLCLISCQDAIYKIDWSTCYLSKITFLNEQIVVNSVHSGMHHFILECVDGLYGMGSNRQGQLGLGLVTERVTTPTKIDFFNGKNVSLVQCGHSNTFCVADGVLYGFGSNRLGQLGLGNVNLFLEPAEIQFYDEELKSHDIKQISCGPTHTLILLESGEVLAFGSNTNGELGWGNRRNQFYPKINEYFNDKVVLFVYCDFKYSLFLLENNIIVGCGRNIEKQLGKENMQYCSYPVQIDLPDDIEIPLQARTRFGKTKSANKTFN